MVVELAEATNIIIFTAFGAFIIISALLLYMGRKMNPEKKVTLPWMVLAFGSTLIGLSYLVQVGNVTYSFFNSGVLIGSTVLVITGTMMILTSFTTLYLENAEDLAILEKRHKEIQQIMERLKKRYFSHELDESELKKLYASLVKELAEIEVRIKEIEK